MSEKKDNLKLMSLINQETTPEQLVDIVGQFITEEDLKVFGDKDSASQLVADSIAYLGVFAPYPATFSKESFLNTSTLGLPQDQAEKIWEIDKRIGVFKDESSVEKDRVSISEEQASIYHNFLT